MFRPSWRHSRSSAILSTTSPRSLRAKRERTSLSASTNPAFIAIWRDYEANYVEPIAEALRRGSSTVIFWPDCELVNDERDLESPAKSEKSFETRCKEIDRVARSDAKCPTRNSAGLR